MDKVTSKAKNKKIRAPHSRSTVEMAKVVGKRILLIREGLGYSQDEFSKKLQISKSTLSGYECGHRLPAIETLIEIAGLKNQTLDFILQADKEEFEHTLEEDILLEIFNNTSKKNRQYIIESARGIARVGAMYDTIGEDADDDAVDEDKK